MAKATPEELAVFENQLTRFQPTDLPSILNILESGDRAIIFLGRPSCKFCRRFIVTLLTVMDDTGQSMQFLDSRDKETLLDFRTQYGIATVPALIKIDHHKLDFVCNSKLSAAEIQTFLNESQPSAHQAV